MPMACFKLAEASKRAIFSSVFCKPKIKQESSIANLVLGGPKNGSKVVNYSQN